MHRLLCTMLVFVATMLATQTAFAFDYIEHLWFTDDACRRVQKAVADQLGSDDLDPDDRPFLERGYLALALACPARWDGPYCDRGWKRARGHVSEPLPREVNRYSITLGDYSALGDHVSRQGPIRNIPRAGERGLVRETLRWLTGKSRVDGPIGDVAEDACEVRDLADFASVTRDVDERFVRWRGEPKIPDVDTNKLVPLARGPVRRGPHDPPMKYSFDNPHYLDLVLRNHHHFGDAAHDAWNGFHSAATAMRTRSCEELIEVDDDEAEDLADTVPGFERVRWGPMDDEERSRRVCAMLRQAVRGRLIAWSEAAPGELRQPVVELLRRIRGSDEANVLADLRLLDGIVVDLLSLVMEGTSLHYVQDGLAAGHMRTIRSREALVEVRHDHDADNRDGVAASLDTRAGRTTLVAWGDGYLLGKTEVSCDPDSEDPNVVTACLLGDQRAILTGATMASLTDWALGGRAYGRLRCDTPLEQIVCLALPLRAPAVAGTPQPDISDSRLLPGALPVPPPNFSFESLSMSLSYGPWERTPALALRFAAFSELARPAHWLRSWQFRAQLGLGQGRGQNLEIDTGFGFHYRFYARVMLDLVPLAFVGIRDFSDGTDVYAGVMPRFGFTIHPEGWVKIPIEFSLFVEQPLVLVSSNTDLGSEIGDDLPRVGLGFGLAFMH